MSPDEWRVAKELSYSEMGRLLRLPQPGNARRYCLPRSDRAWRRPSDAILLRLRDISEGAISVAEALGLPASEAA